MSVVSHHNTCRALFGNFWSPATTAKSRTLHPGVFLLGAGGARPLALPPRAGQAHVARRVDQRILWPPLPEFQYRAVDSSGVVENEVCPVFVARLNPGAELAPNPEEVDSVAWTAPAALIAAADTTPFAFSPWLVEELADQRLRDAIS